MRKLYSVGLAAVAAAALTVTGGSAASAGQSGSDTVTIPSWVSDSPTFADDFTGCSSHHADNTTSSTLP
jgi:ABC-type glycerol-3-phosphate transport system substrate-binding protein